MNKQNPDLVGDDDDDYENNFCEMFNGLSKGLLVPVVNICNSFNIVSTNTMMMCFCVF